MKEFQTQVLLVHLLFFPLFAVLIYSFFLISNLPVEYSVKNNQGYVKVRVSSYGLELKKSAKPKYKWLKMEIKVNFSL